MRTLLRGVVNSLLNFSGCFAIIQHVFGQWAMGTFALAASLYKPLDTFPEICSEPLVALCC